MHFGSLCFWNKNLGLGAIFKEVILSLLKSITVKSTPYLRLLASISVLGGGGWAWEHPLGRRGLGWEGVVGGPQQ